MQEFLDATQRLLPACGAQDLAMLIWSLAHMGDASTPLPSPQWLQSYCRCAMLQLAGMDSLAVQNMLFGLARLQQRRLKQLRRRQAAGAAGDPAAAAAASDAGGRGPAAAAAIAAAAPGAQQRQQAADVLVDGAAAAQGQLVAALLNWVHPHISTLPANQLADIVVSVAELCPAGCGPGAAAISGEFVHAAAQALQAHTLSRRQSGALQHALQSFVPV